MNKGWKKSTGDLVAMLNADGYYLPDTLEKVAESYHQNQADIIYGGMTKLRSINQKEYFKEVLPDLSKMERTMGIFHPSTFVSRKVYEELNGYDETYRLSSDYDFLLRAYKKQYSFQEIKASLAVFRIGGVSNMNCDSFKEGYQILLKNNSAYAPEMKRAISRCKFKKSVKQIINILVRTFGLQRWFNQRLIKKWE